MKRLFEIKQDNHSTLVLSSKNWKNEMLGSSLHLQLGSCICWLKMWCRIPQPHLCWTFPISINYWAGAAQNRSKWNSDFFFSQRNSWISWVQRHAQSNSFDKIHCCNLGLWLNLKFWIQFVVFKVHFLFFSLIEIEL